MLVDAGRIDLDTTVENWVTRFLDQPGIAPVPLDCRAAASSYRLHQFERRDPADRLLIATAIELRCPIVSYDEPIIRFAERYGDHYGFTAVR